MSAMVEEKLHIHIRLDRFVPDGGRIHAYDFIWCHECFHCIWLGLLLFFEVDETTAHLRRVRYALSTHYYSSRNHCNFTIIYFHTALVRVIW